MADIAHEAGLLPDEPVLAGAAKLFSYLWNVAWEHADGTVNGDADALHDMRVALRRLRSALQNFEGPKDAPLLGPRLRRELATERRRLGKLGDVLGAVRDHDVLDDYLKEYAAKRLKRPVADSPGLATLENFLYTERKEAFEPMVKSINKALKEGSLREEFARFALGLPGADAPPLLTRGAAQIILPRHIDEVLQHAAVLDDADNAEAHHELRKALRRTRYTLETLGPCFREPVKDHIKTLVQLQDYLGEMQDRAVLQETAHKAFGVDADGGHDDKEKQQGETLPKDVAAFLRYGERRRRLLLGKVRKSWHQHQESGFFQTLRQLV